MHPLAPYVAYHQGELVAEADAQRLAKAGRPSPEGRMTSALHRIRGLRAPGARRARTLARA
jgi:hypothetical protein